MAFVAADASGENPYRDGSIEFADEHPMKGSSWPSVHFNFTALVVANNDPTAVIAKTKSENLTLSDRIAFFIVHRFIFFPLRLYCTTGMMIFAIGKPL